MMEDGLRGWRDALEDNESSAPETATDKQRSKDIYNRLGVVMTTYLHKVMLNHSSLM